MRSSRLLTAALCAVATLGLSKGASAQSTGPVYQTIATIPLPGGLASFDIAWVDPGTQRFYLADRTTTKGTGRIDVIDTQTNTFLYSIPTRPTEFGFTGTVPAVTRGCSISGPNGVVAVPQRNQLYVGDGDSTVKVVDLAAQAIVAIIPTNGKCRADELAYDPVDHLIVIANPADNPPYLTFISTDTQSVVGTYTYPASQNGFGLEQSLYVPLTKRFYISRPASTGNMGSVDVFNPTSMQMEASYPTPCSPAGLVVTANQHLVTSCGTVLDVRTGNVLASPSGAVSDQIWYNTGDNLVYFGLGKGAVLDAETNQIVSNLPSGSSHTLAVDPNNNHIFAPVSGIGIRVFAAQ